MNNIKKKLNIYIKIILFSLMGFCVSFFLLCLNDTGFILPSKMIESWNTDYFSNTTKLTLVIFIFVAIGMAVSSTSIQNFNRNYIATGSTLGIGASGTSGYLMSKLFKIYDYYFIIFVMIVVSTVPVILIYLLIAKSRKAQSSVILIGLAMTAILGAVNYIIRDVTGELNTSLIWLGSFRGNTKWDMLFYVLPMLFVGLIIFSFNIKNLNIISKSMKIAHSMNVPFGKTYLMTSISNILIIVSMVFLCGEISFLGIIGTNIVRYLIKSSSTAFVAIGAISFNMLVLFLAKILFAYFDFDMLLSIVILASPVFLFVILRRENG